MLLHVDTFRSKQEREAEKATVIETPEADTETGNVPHKWQFLILHKEAG